MTINEFLQMKKPIWIKYEPNSSFKEKTFALIGEFESMDDKNYESEIFILIIERDNRHNVHIMNIKRGFFDKKEIKSAVKMGKLSKEIRHKTIKDIFNGRR